MTDLPGLIAIALLFTALAIVVALVRGVTGETARRDATTAVSATLGATTAASVCFGLSGALEASPVWRELGSFALTVGPVAVALALRLRCRRPFLRACVPASVALAAVVVWLTVHLQGPRAGWPFFEIAIVMVVSSVAIAAAACCGAWTKHPRRPHATAAVVLLSSLILTGCSNGNPSQGTLTLTIVDAASGRPTPARVELLNVDDESIVPDDALSIFADCGSPPFHNWLTWTDLPQALRGRHRDVSNPYTGTTQFYVDGSISTHLAPGRYRVKATKGLEFRVSREEVVIARGETRTLRLGLERWIDLPREGWYGADDHLHIPRPHPRLDPAIATWMQAEDLHVANLLQMGLARDVHVTPQHRFGSPSVHRAESTLIVSGQENPRTHVLGHSIILGARRWIDLPRTYPLYDRFWSEAHAHGGVNGYAHWGLGGAEEGLALWGHRELLDFIEVLNLGFPFYERWYEALNVGLRIGPTAGTDYPCLPSLPGRERFYARLEGSLEYDAWLEAVRRGRTFVTNGPVIELSVDGVAIGDELRLPSPGSVHVVGRVRFDVERDDVTRLELIEAGEPVSGVETRTGPGTLEIDTTIDIRESTWLALRAHGEKRDETRLDVRERLQSMLVLKRRTNEDVIRAVPEGLSNRPSTAHTGAVWVTVDGTPPIAAQAEADDVIEAWLDRLDDLEARFDDARIDELAGFPGRGDGIDEATLLANRAALLAAVETARGHYSAR